MEQCGDLNNLKTLNFGGFFMALYDSGIAFKMADDRETIRIAKLQSVEIWPMNKFQICVIIKAREIWEIISGD